VEVGIPGTIFLCVSNYRNIDGDLIQCLWKVSFGTANLADDKESATFRLKLPCPFLVPKSI
jgi:hypothetical protein